MRSAARAFAVAVGLLVAGCGSPSRTEADRHVVEGSSTLLNPKGQFDEESARADSVADVSALSFEDSGDAAECSGDCSGHSSGFEWAKENAAGDPSMCVGDSDSFVEGCQAFSHAVEAHVESMRDEWESGQK